MLIGKINIFKKIILVAFILFIVSCDENSFVVDSSFGDDFEKTFFILNQEESGTIRQEGYSTANSSRTYLGNNSSIYSLYELDLNVIGATSFCSDTSLISVDEIEFKVISSKNIFNLYMHQQDSIDYVNNDIIDHELMGPQSYIKAYFIDENINFDEGSTENYNAQRIEEVEAYKNMENLIPAIYNNYELTFLLSNFISPGLICTSFDSKYYILIEYDNSSNIFEENIELFSSDHSIILLNPKLNIEYSKEVTEIEYENKYNIIDVISDHLNSNQFIVNDNAATQEFGKLLSFSFENLELNDIDEDLEINSLDTLVFAGDSLDNFLTYRISLNETLLDSIIDLSFYFEDVIFAYNDLDPQNDNWIASDSIGTEGNDLYDYQEYFYDYGFDNCSDQDEAGNGICNTSLSIYNDLGTELNGLLDWEDTDEDLLWSIGEGEEWFDYGLDQVEDLYESGCFSDSYPYGIPILIPTTYMEILDLAFPGIDEPQFSEYLYISSESCQNINIDSCIEDTNCENDIIDICNDNSFCSWNELTSECYNIEVNICGPDYWTENSNCISCSYEDPNGDNNNSDPSNDNYDELSNIDGTENNGAYDLGEPFLDFGLDQIPDSIELSLGYQFDDDNWSEQNPNGKENNGIYDLGEIFFDFGIDGVSNVQEEGYNIGSQNNNNFDNPLNAYVYYELFNDYGLDNVPNSDDNDDPNDDYIIDPNSDNYHYLDNIDGLENNGVWDHDDVGIDGCSDLYETGNVWIDEICSNPIFDNINDCLCSDQIVSAEIDDPNNDNYHQDTNVIGTEGNGIIDQNEKYEFWDDYGTDNIINELEPGYLNNSANINLGTNLYSLEINQLSNVDDRIIYDPPFINNEDEVIMWISSITKVEDFTYDIKVSLLSLLNINGFQLKLNHFKYSDTELAETNEQVYFYPYEYIDDDNDFFPDINELVDGGSKYIKDVSMYLFDSPEADSLSISYHHGFITQIYFDELENFIADNQNALISDNLTKLKLYIDHNNSNIDENGTKIEVLVHDESSSTELVPLNITNDIGVSILEDIFIYPDTDSITIPIAPLIQKMMLDEVSFGIDGKPYIYLGVNDYSNNLSKVYLRKMMPTIILS